MTWVVEADTQLLREEIDPKLEKLRAEKRSYLEYQKATSELERLTRLVKAYEWTLAVDKTQKAGDNLKRKKAEIESTKEDISRGGTQCQGMEKELVDVQKRRDKVGAGVVSKNRVEADLAGVDKGRKAASSD
jgi:structural maintenance of chromosome 2